MFQKKRNKCNLLFNSKYFNLFSLNYKQIVEDEDDDEEEDNTIVLELENDDLIKFNNKNFNIKKEKVKIAININNKDYLKLAKLNRAREVFQTIYDSDILFFGKDNYYINQPRLPAVLTEEEYTSIVEREKKINENQNVNLNSFRYTLFR